MKVLMISNDKNILEDGSEARERMIEYGKLVEELHIIILAPVFAKPACRQGRAMAGKQNFGNLFLYPTNSKSKWFYILDAYKIGKNIIGNCSERSGLKTENCLITAQDPFECGLVGWLIKRKFQTRLQLQAHTDFLSPYFKKESFINKIRVIIARFLVPKADCIRVVSERVKESIISNFPALLASRKPQRGELAGRQFSHSTSPVDEVAGGRAIPKITILPIFVNVKAIQEAPVRVNLREKYPQFDFIILTASRLTREKNIDLAIGSMLEIIKKHPKAGLIIVGSGNEEAGLKSMVADLKLSDNIIFEDWNDDLASYYKIADLFLLTSNYEGYGRAVVEAMAAGCPVTMTDVGIAGEILKNKENGLVIPVGNKEKLIAAIFSLMENKDLAVTLVRNAGKTVSFWPTKELYLENYRDSWLTCNNA